MDRKREGEAISSSERRVVLETETKQGTNRQSRQDGISNLVVKSLPERISLLDDLFGLRDVRVEELYEIETDTTDASVRPSSSDNEQLPRHRAPPVRKGKGTHESHDLMTSLQILSQDILLLDARVGIDRVRDWTALDRSHLSSYNHLLLGVLSIPGQLSTFRVFPRKSSSQPCRACRRPTRKRRLRIVTLLFLLFSDFRKTLVRSDET